MLVLLAVVALALAVGIYIGYPLFVSDGQDNSSSQETHSLRFRKESAALDLNDLEIDFRLGKIGETDYQAMRERIIAERTDCDVSLSQAAPGVGSTESAKDNDDAAEALISARRAAKKAGKPAGACPACAHVNPVNARFCMNCGAKIGRRGGSES
jgi:hypothetical protein